MEFEGRKMVIATMHEKEKVIAPILENNLHVNCFITDKLDTDAFGTFSGDVERSLSPIDTLRAKCNAAMNLTKCDLAVASEGSFGNHPLMFFANAHEEIVMLLDRKNGFEIVEREISMVTNMNSSFIKSVEELMAFADKCKFPSHALIVKNREANFSYIKKGIQSIEQLIESFHECKLKFTSVFVETDMRAMYNPTRMEVIEKATYKLMNKLQKTCPICTFPGFSVQEVITGLPCSLCHKPTKSTEAFIYRCKKCGFEECEEFPHGKNEENPMFCDFCNP